MKRASRARVEGGSRSRERNLTVSQKTACDRNCWNSFHKSITSDDGPSRSIQFSFSDFRYECSVCFRVNVSFTCTCMRYAAVRNGCGSGTAIAYHWARAKVVHEPGAQITTVHHPQLRISQPLPIKLILRKSSSKFKTDSLISKVSEFSA